MIKACYLLSYDYAYILTSIQLIYDNVDQIIVSYDSENKTWVGNSINIPASFFDELKKLDHQNKIMLYKDVFFIEGKEPMELETRQRNMMAHKIGMDGWHIQIDGDEYAYDFKEISQFLKRNKFLLKIAKKKPFNFEVNLVTLFKHNDEGFFVITPFDEKCPLITSKPVYRYARRLKEGKILNLDYYLIHQSWARNEDEILQKISNWGHKNDFDTKEFFNNWKNLNSENYKSYQNFHPLNQTAWKQIEFFPAKSIEEFIHSFSEKYPQKKLKLELSTTKKIKLWLKSLL